MLSQSTLCLSFIVVFFVFSLDTIRSAQAEAARAAAAAQRGAPPPPAGGGKGAPPPSRRRAVLGSDLSDNGAAFVEHPMSLARLQAAFSSTLFVNACNVDGAPPPNCFFSKLFRRDSREEKKTRASLSRRPAIRRRARADAGAAAGWGAGGARRGAAVPAAAPPNRRPHLGRPQPPGGAHSAGGGQMAGGAGVGGVRGTGIYIREGGGLGK